MSFTFRPAVLSDVALIFGLAGGTGSGKTFTAMRLARGISGDKPFAVIDTEAGRAKHYADQFRFDHGDLEPPFSPARYIEAIAEADKADYPVIVVDSFSHEWAGDGGVLDMQEAELDRMAGNDYGKRERVKMAAWIKPKGEHKRMVQKLLQVRAHLILCFRAEPKVEMVKNKEGKLEIQAKHSLVGRDGWIPICEKNLPFETTCYFLLLASAPGMPQPIKLQEQHRSMFPLGEHITEQSGRLVAQWASGKKTQTQSDVVNTTTAAATGDAPADDYIDANQCANLETQCQDAGIPLERLRAAAKVDRLAMIKKADYQRAVDWIAKASIKAA